MCCVSVCVQLRFFFFLAFFGSAAVSFIPRMHDFCVLKYFLCCVHMYTPLSYVPYLRSSHTTHVLYSSVLASSYVLCHIRVSSSLSDGRTYITKLSETTHTIHTQHINFTYQHKSGKNKKINLKPKIQRITKQNYCIKSKSSISNKKTEANRK